MDNEAILAKLAEMEEKISGLAEENAQLRRGAGPGVQATPDSVHRNLGRLSPARSVTIATRPVQDAPEDYPTAVYKEVGRKGEEE